MEKGAGAGTQGGRGRQERRVGATPNDNTSRKSGKINLTAYSIRRKTLPAPEIISKLVQQFIENRESYRSGRYNEAQLRQEFLNPFFEALGWDMDNRKGFAPQNREVIHEDSIEVEGESRAPDYCFRLGQTRKFFVEAKKPAVDIKYDIHPAFQLRRYAWNAHLPLSILTDFEEFAVYDCRNRPNPTDSAATARVKFFTFTEYMEKWDEIAAIFSHDAVWKGSFDKYAADTTRRRGTTEVDDEFLKDIEEWRKKLALNLALRNPTITHERQLNFAVQMTIDRLIFLRICEDREIERINQLQDIAKEGNIYDALLTLFNQADRRYNSGLFHLHAEKDDTSVVDTFTPTLKIDDKVLKDIIQGLYYPCPYIFKEIPVEILGQVYEQFLGKVIRLTAGHQAKVEEKPEVRKAGGVYYTPKYIVDYIVANTVGKLLDKKKPDEASRLKIVDPACGSGSFLLGAYQHLLDWHADWYIKHTPEKWCKGKTPTLIACEGGGWRLTTAEKKRILVNNIHGVDIDAQAVEVTKLSLLLKVLEEESGQMVLGFERILPDLGRNIQCGNSLIGEDYFEGRLVVDAEERERVNPFEWQRAFPQVFAQGGFDTVIGNPPYVRIQTMKEWTPHEVLFYNNNFQAAGTGNYDIYGLFIEKGHSILNNDGFLSFIIGSKWLRANYADNLRKLIGKFIMELIDFSYNQVFENAFVNTCIIKITKKNRSNFEYIEIPKTTNINLVVNELQNKNIPVNIQSLSFENNLFHSSPWQFVTPSIRELINKIIRNRPTLEKVSSRIYQGIKTGGDKIFLVDVISITENDLKVFSNELKREIAIEKGLLKPLFRGSQVKRYYLINENRAIIFPYKTHTVITEKEMKKNYPKAYSYFHENKMKLESRENGLLKGKNWYGYTRNQALNIIESPKILTPDLSRSVAFAYDEKGEVFFPGGAAGGYGIILKENWHYLYVLGVLNSRLIDFYIKQNSTQMESGFFSFEARFIRSVPINEINFTNPDEVKQHDQMVALVERMLTLHKQSPATPQEQVRLQREIDATDREIDALVYTLYSLADEEIRIVEGE